MSCEICELVDGVGAEFILPMDRLNKNKTVYLCEHGSDDYNVVLRIDEYNSLKDIAVININHCPMCGEKL